MDDLISRQAAIDAADYTDYRGLTIEDVKNVTDEVVKELKKLPPVDAVQVVRCKDCKHRFEGEKFPNCCDVLMEMSQWLVEIPVKDEWHCASAERKES